MTISSDWKHSTYFAFYTWSVFYIYPVRSPWSVVRSPQPIWNALPGCVACVMLQGYNKSILINEKTFRSFLWKRLGHDTGKLWIAVGVTFPPETARRRHGTLLHYKTTAILFAVAPFLILPSPTRHSYIWSVFNFCFSRIRKSKNDFHFGFHHHWYCFPQFRYTWIECVYLSANRFSMAWENGIQMPFTFFVFAWHWLKQIWILLFVFRFRITLKNGHEFHFSLFVYASLWKTDNKVAEHSFGSLWVYVIYQIMAREPFIRAYKECLSWVPLHLSLEHIFCATYRRS